MIFVSFLNCKSEEKKNSSEKKINPTDSLETDLSTNKEILNDSEFDVELKQIIIGLDKNCPNLKDPWNFLFDGKTDYGTVSFDRQKESWIFDLEKKDSKQFEKAYNIYPKCKLYENDKIISIIFADLYDYHSALHIFNFEKPELKPKSSFILYSQGGDAEDFWDVEFEKLNELSYKITETNGYYNDVETADTTYISLRINKKIMIDSITGFIKTDILKTEKNIIEYKK